MTDLIPFIIEDNGDGTARGRRITDLEVSDYFQRLLQWAPNNSVVFKAGNGNVGALRMLPNTLLARIGTEGSVAGANAPQVVAMLGLPALLAAKSDTGHAHGFVAGITDINWSTLDDDRLLARVGGQFTWIPISSGGTGGLTNPLGGDLDLGGNALVSGDIELIKFQAGKIYIAGQELIPTALGGAIEGQVPRFNELTGKFESANAEVTDILGVLPGQFLAVGADGKVEEVDPPVGGGTGTGTSGTSYPAGPNEGQSFLRTDSVRNAVYRYDLPIKFADADVVDLNGWVATSERAVTVHRTDLDLKLGDAYVVGDGYGAGFYFAEETVIRRFSINFGATTSGTLQFRINTANSGLSIKHTIAIATVASYTEESWIVVPADSLLSLHGGGFVNVTPEISAEFIVSPFTATADVDPQPV